MTSTHYPASPPLSGDRGPRAASSARVAFVEPDTGADHVRGTRLARALAKAGADITHVIVGPDEAAPALEGERADVVLADAGVLWAWNREMAGAPLIALVAAGDIASALVALEKGANAVAMRDDSADFVHLLAAMIASTVAADRAARIARIEADELRVRADVLLEEMKHRIANSLALVVSTAHLQAGAMLPGDARKAVEAFASRVNGIAQVHKGLYSSFDIRTLAIDTYLAGLVRQLNDNYTGRRALTGISFSSIALRGTVDQAISLGVILSELIANAARFAYAGSTAGGVQITLQREGEGEAVLRVRDQGSGAADSCEPTPGLGLQLVDVLADSLGGRFELQRDARGTQAEVHFPMPPAAMLGEPAQTSNC